MPATVVGIVPAAGRGSRLGSAGPKALAPLLGQTLVAHVLAAVAPAVDHLVLVIRPGDEERFAAELERIGWDTPVTMSYQERATGSADAVSTGLGAAAPGSACLVVWADQVGVSTTTACEVARQLRQEDPPLILPLTFRSEPYVWVELSAAGTVEQVGRRRDGDPPPRQGWADVGLFGLGRESGLRCIREEFPEHAQRTRERDFVYVLPRLSDECGLRVVTVQSQSEATAINTACDLQRAARELGGRR